MEETIFEHKKNCADKVFLYLYILVFIGCWFFDLVFYQS
jgi:hypothetical protein